MTTNQGMEHTFDITVSQKDADTALRRFILRSAGWETLIAVLLCLAYVAYDILGGNLGYLAIGIIALLLILFVAILAAFLTRRKQITGLLRKIGNQPISYQLNHSEISTRSPMGSSTLKWEMIRKLWIDPDLTLVFFTRDGYTTIPTDQIPPQALDFLASRVKDAGGKIRNKNNARTTS